MIHSTKKSKRTDIERKVSMNVIFAAASNKQRKGKKIQRLCVLFKLLLDRTKLLIANDPVNEVQYYLNFVWTKLNSIKSAL